MLATAEKPLYYHKFYLYQIKYRKNFAKIAKNVKNYKNIGAPAKNTLCHCERSEAISKSVSAGISHAGVKVFSPPFYRGLQA